MLAVLVAGSLAAAIVWRFAEMGADDRQFEAADELAESVERNASDLIVALSGTSALVAADGSVSQAAMDRFAADLAGVGTPRPIAWVVPVTGTDGQGGWQVAMTALPPPSQDDGNDAGRDNDTGSGNEGSSSEGAAGGGNPSVPDLAVGTVEDADSSVASLAAAAQSSGRSVLGRVTLADGTTRLAAAKPVFRVDDDPSTEPEFMGVMVAVDPSGHLSGRLATEVPSDVLYTISDGAVVLASSNPPPTGGDVRSVQVGNLALSALVEDRRAVNHDLSWFLLWVMAVIVAAVGTVGLRSARYDEERRRTNAMIARTADLAQRLARSATADEVAAVISEQVPPLFGADVASFGEVDAEAALVRLHHGADVDPALVERLSELHLEDIPTLVDQVGSGTTVLMRSSADWQRELPGDVADGLLAAGARAGAVLPLQTPEQRVVATIGIIWCDPPTFDERTTATLGTVRELCEQSLLRAELTDRASHRAARLAALAEQLAGVDTVVDAARTVTDLALDLVGATAATIGVIDHENSVLRTYHGNTVTDRAQDVFSALRLDDPLAVTDAARTGRAVMCTDLAEYEERYPGTHDANVELGAGARAAFPLRADDRAIGSIVFAWDRPVTFDDPEVDELTTVAEMTAQAVRQAQLLETQAAEAVRNKALSELAQGLASRSEAADIAGFLTESVLAPLGATYSVISVVDSGHLLRRFSDRLVQTELTDLGRQYASTDLATATPATDAARSGRLVFVEGPTDAYERYPSMAPVWDALEVQSGAAVPVRDRDGQVVAVISVMWDRPISVRGDVRDTLATVAGMVGQTLERTDLVDELRTNVVRNQRMADLARLLADTQTLDELCHTVRNSAAPPVGAAFADIVLLREDGTVSAEHVATDPPWPLVDTADDEPPRLTDTVTAALRGRTVVELLDDDLTAGLSQQDVAALRDAAIVHVALLPLSASDGTGLGVVVVGWDDSHRPAADNTAKLGTLTELCGQTVLRTRLREAEHRLVVSLQDRVVRPATAMSGLAIAERYQPASVQVGMGGDWFEGIPIDDHRFAVVVGDIAGHGITAVADMVELRAIIGALLRSATPLEEVYPRVASLLHLSGSGLTATSCTAMFDTSSDSVHYVSAGHLPPVLATADGRVELLEQGRQPLLGVPSRPVTPGTAPFVPGSLLALYTDGIVERRSEAIDVSLERLRSATAAVVSAPTGTGPTGTGQDVEHVADELLRRCLGDRSTDDDVALVVVARTTDGSQDPSVD